MAVLLLLVTISSALGIVLLRDLEAVESTLAQSAQPYLADLTAMAVAAKAAANDERGYLLTGDPKFLDETATSVRRSSIPPSPTL